MRLVCTILFLLTWGLSAAFLYKHWGDEQQKRLNENNVVLATTYRASVAMYRLSTEILFAEVIQRPEVIASFAEGVLGNGKNRDLARGRLYRLLSPAYTNLKQRGIQQLHFHTADGHSFLRFHAPDKFGDALFEVRPSVRLANEQKRAVFGFENGRMNSGFRYVFPLFRETQHLGSVETSITFRKISEAMAEINPGCEYLLVLRKSDVARVLFKEQRALYDTSPVHDDFLVEDPQLHLPSSPPPLTATVQALNARLKDDPRVLSGMLNGQTFSLPVSSASGDWSVTFEPINDLLGANVAYVISYAKAPYLTDLRHDFLLNLAFATLTLGGLFWLTLRLLTSHATLRHEKQHLQIITDTIADGLFVMDQQGHLVQVNPAFTDILGYQADEVIGKVGHNIFHVHGDGSACFPLVQCPIFSATQKGQDYFGEEIFRHKNGHLLTVELSCKPIINNALIDGSVTALRDITERKANEERLRETDRLKNEFLANVSHEFRTPLTVIMAAVEHLQDIVKDLEHRKLLEIVDQASQRLHKLINEILDFSKIEAKKLVIYKARFNLSNCLNEVVALMNPKAQQKNLLLKLFVAPEVPEFVEGDQYRLGQVLINLIGNAIKFTDEGEVKVSVQRQDNLLEFAISDTGIGIPESKLATIFETFIQADGSSTRRYNGTGLGLSICRGLVELMGGRVKVISQVGQGSVFTFTLPVENHASVS